MPMSSMPSDRFDTEIQPWLAELLNGIASSDGKTTDLAGQPMAVRGGILRVGGTVSEEQAQTSDTFGFKWHKRASFESEAWRGQLRNWLQARYGDVHQAPWWNDYDTPILLDAGCGASVSALELFGDKLGDVRYLGVDISTAVDVAMRRFAERDLDAAFMQADITNLPLPDRSIDVIFSEGVLHHTDSTKKALFSLARLLRPGGRFLFYVYNKKAPIREFTDDYIRAQLKRLDQNETWAAVMPLTKLGVALGELDMEIDIPEPVDLLGIPAGRINLQRLFYWHIFKAFYRPELNLEELNHINFDWYAPANAHRQTPEQVREWCATADMQIEREVVEEAGITIIARKQGKSN